jgi:hypothetical protein
MACASLWVGMMTETRTGLWQTLNELSAAKAAVKKGADFWTA